MWKKLFFILSALFFLDEAECAYCTAGSYCPGNGEVRQCGVDGPTKYMYSFGAASECHPCPKGSVICFCQIIVFIRQHIVDN